MSQLLLDTIARHKAGDRVGVTSVCSAHPLVIEAAVLQAVADGGYVLVEATSNQVDQNGGYTGMRPADFRRLVLDVADAHRLPHNRVVLGGDHLGPNTWRALSGEEAMRHAEELVRCYVEAGFTKIHLDCSMSCADDPAVLEDDVVATRSARLAVVAEAAATHLGEEALLLYVIGTEVPVPGGAHESIETLTPTSADAARLTVARHQEAFADAGVPEVWDRVVGLVVQPGVEFDHLRVVDYDPAATVALLQVVDDHATLAFEAHSTDYQRVEALTALVENHWAILKVGPGLTFALREALFALAAIEDELIPLADLSRLVEVVDERMVAEPRWWQAYYEGDDDAQRLARRYSFSDRVRYYWPDPAIARATDLLLANLTRSGLPLPMLSARLPAQYTRVRSGELAPDPRSIVVDHVRDVLRDYSRACSPDPVRTAR